MLNDRGSYAHFERLALHTSTYAVTTPWHWCLGKCRAGATLLSAHKSRLNRRTRALLPLERAHATRAYSTAMLDPTPSLGTSGLCAMPSTTRRSRLGATRLTWTMRGPRQPRELQCERGGTFAARGCATRQETLFMSAISRERESERE